MSPGTFLLVAILLGVERVCYVGIARAPETFRRVAERPSIARLATPVAVVGALFCVFKAVQLAVFLGWCHAQGEGSLVPVDPDPGTLAVAAVLIGGGQILNLSVFYRLGAVGVFFGDRLGHAVPWCSDFPFSWIAHPQYVGTVLTIWGFFVAMRFPHPDWYVLPILETVYYAVGARLETTGGHGLREDRLAVTPRSRWGRFRSAILGLVTGRAPGSRTGVVVPGRPSSTGSRRD
jgi:hypothetical protein